MKIRINTNEFQLSHGRTPRGGCPTTPWFFQIGAEQKQFNGKYSDAKKAAADYAKSVGAWEVRVLP